MLVFNGAAQAAIEVRVDKSAQRMQVFVDGQHKHNFVVSTGLAGGPPRGKSRSMPVRPDSM